MNFWKIFEGKGGPTCTRDQWPNTAKTLVYQIQLIKYTKYIESNISTTDFVSFFVFLSRHHAHQMSEGSQVSKVTRFVKILKWHPLTQRPRSGIELPGQLKTTCIGSKFGHMAPLVLLNCQGFTSLYRVQLLSSSARVTSIKSSHPMHNRNGEPPIGLHVYYRGLRTNK